MVIVSCFVFPTVFEVAVPFDRIRQILRFNKDKISFN